MDSAEVKKMVREGLCKDCAGLRLGGVDCDSEDLCKSFHEECAAVVAESQS